MKTIQAVVLVAFAAAQTARASEVVATGKVSLHGESSLHPYHADTERFTAVFALDEGATGSFSDIVQAGHVRSLAVTIPVKTLKSGDNGLDKNMWAALKEPQFPTVTLRVDRYKFDAAGKDGALKGKVTASLTIAGVTKSVELDTTATPTPTGVRFAGQLDLLMSQYGIKPPELMFGVIKTADKVTIQFDVAVRTAP